MFANLLPEKARRLAQRNAHAESASMPPPETDLVSGGGRVAKDASSDSDSEGGVADKSKAILMSKEELMKDDALYHKFEFFDNFCVIEPKEGAAEKKEEESHAEKLVKFLQFEEINNRTK